MNLHWGLLASVATTQAAGNAATMVRPAPAWLETADTGLIWIGLGVMGVAALAWLTRGRGDPLVNLPPRPNRLRPEPVMVLAGGYVVVSMLVGQVVEWWSGLGGYRLTAGTGVQMAGGLACLGLGARYFEGGVRGFVIGEGQVWRRVGQGVVWVIAAMAMCHLIYESTLWGMGRVWPGYQPPEHSVLEALQQGSESAWLLRLGAVLIAPVAEECFFRGIFQTTVRNIYGRAWPAIIFSGVLFGLAHSNQPQVVPTLVALGILLGVLYERTGSLTGPIVLHVLFNLKTVIWQGLGAGP